MLKELSWYIESNRFTEIVQEFEEKAEAYSQSITLADGSSEEKREAFRAFCQWHMKKSGFRNEEVPFIDVDAEFFNGAEINRSALNTFEKEIIKAHMYQKHLWEFMGTTGSMTVISKTAMKKDGFIYEKYLPFEYKKNHPAKSPISNILNENKNAVPIYMYLDGTVSSDYDPEKSIARFDSIQDKSGFDWSRKGWDPNYEIKRSGWHGEFDQDGNWIMVQEKSSSAAASDFPGARFEKIPELEILKEKDQAILYDSGYSLLSTIERFFLLDNGEIYGSEVEDIFGTVKLIQVAMERLGVTKIKAIAGTLNETDKGGKEISEKIDFILESYKKILKDSASEKLILLSEEDFKKSKKEIIEKNKKSQISEAGRSLSVKISEICEKGTKGDALEKAISSNLVKVPLSVYNKADCIKAGVSEADYSIIQNYYVPDEKQEVFSAAILNLLLEEKLLSTSGKSKEEIFDIVYKTVVQNEKNEEVISVETTLEELCRNPEKNLGVEPVEDFTLEKLREVQKSIPEQRTPEKQREIDLAIENVIRNFSAIRMSTGMSPEEAVKAAVKILGGRTGDPFVPPVSGIVYQTPGMNGGSSGSKRVFADLSLQELIEKAVSKPVQTKEVSINKEIVHNQDSKEKAVNLFDDKIRQKWFKSEEFKRLGLSEEQAERLIQQELEKIIVKQEANQKKQSNISSESILDEKYGFIKNETKEDFYSIKIEPVTKAVSAQETVARLSEKSADQEKVLYKPAQIRGDGRINRTISTAVTSIENVVSFDNGLAELLLANEALVSEIKNLSGLEEVKLENGMLSVKDAELIKSKILYGSDVNVLSPEAVAALYKYILSPAVTSPKELQELLAVSSESAGMNCSYEKVKSVISSLSGYEGFFNKPGVLYAKSGINVSSKKFLGTNVISESSNGIVNEANIKVSEKKSVAGQNLSGIDGISSINSNLKGNSGQASVTDNLTGISGSPVLTDNLDGLKGNSALSVNLEGLNHNISNLENLTGADGILISSKSMHQIEENRLETKNMIGKDGLFNSNRKTVVLDGQISTSKNLTGKNEISSIGKKFEEVNAASVNGTSNKEREALYQKNDVLKSKENVSEKNSGTKDFEYSSAQVLSSKDLESIRLEKINRNYEHDKAILAKEDPNFIAKNQFWDVGHADGVEELSDREMEKIVSKITRNKLNELIGGK